MLQALAQLGDGDDGNELPGPDAYQLRQQYKQAVTQQVVEQMVAVVAPHRHLALSVVQRMQAPPPVEAVLRPVYPVIDEIEEDQVDGKARHGLVGDAGQELVEMKCTEARDSQGA